ncbi:DUF1467 family protein [Aurantiacibacter aquimixticola]|uniref:DUF1467 family protein n=1 Tax=Aurantiacibacter aquimixticola TaxID=1958945 RepID=A0A419RRY2_9SPHN|nr:DUF1467 family protein [Aurantiacibacter aquimixticola]RJY08563.1 DUF1467 family protein [Aurantiacibacter aquimixticola]
MEITSVIAIYALFWVMSAFLLLPFGIQTADEVGAKKVPGQADSAPANFKPGRVAIRATFVAAVLCAVYIANYVQGWITVDDINIFGTPAGYETPTS